MAIGPVLETVRLRLEPFSQRFLTTQYVGWLNDEEVVRFSELRHSHHDEASCLTYLKSFESSAGFYWAISVKDGPLGHIGNISVNIDAPNQVADIGILIGEKHAWGKGYGREAWQVVCHFLQTTPNIRKITAGMMACNTAMVHTAQAAGMVEEARRPGHFLRAGKPEDVVYWALCRTPNHAGRSEDQPTDSKSHSSASRKHQS